MTFPAGCGGWISAHGVRIPCARHVPNVWICPRCLKASERALKLRNRLADEQARRDRRQGKQYGKPKPGEDVYRGFRGEE